MQLIVSIHYTNVPNFINRWISAEEIMLIINFVVYAVFFLYIFDSLTFQVRRSHKHLSLLVELTTV